MSGFLGVFDSLSTTESNITSCDGGTVENSVFFIAWIIALFFSFFLIAVQKRSHHCPGCCFGRPGLPVPVNFLVTPRNRLIYSVLFGIMGYSLLNTFSSIDVSLPGNNIYLSVFNKILWNPFITVLALVVEYFPLFASVEFQYPIVGYVVGFVYSIIWFLAKWIPRFFVYHSYASSCGSSIPDITTVTVNVLQDTPLIMMSFSVILWFFYKIIFYCYEKFSNKDNSYGLGDLNDPQKGIRQYHIDHVRSLLKRSVVHNEEEKKSIIHRVVNYIFPFKRNYKLPLPLLGAIMAMVIIIYQLSLSLIIVTLTTLIQLAQNYNNVLKPIFNENNLYELDRILSTIFIGLPTMMVLAPIFALLLATFLLVHMISSISKTTKDFAKHGFEIKLPPRHLILSAYSKYLGAQIGLFIIAWLLYYVVFLVVLVVLVIAGLLLVVSSTTRAVAVVLIVTSGIPLVWSQLINIGQTLIAKFVFLEDRKLDSKFIPVKHRQLYNWFGFVLFFYNGFAGLVSAIIRIILNVVFGILLLFRLDIQFLPSHLWWWDFGHKSFLGFIYMDYCYNNAVMHVFSHLLENSVVDQNMSKEETKVELVEDITAAKPHNKRARNRWFVAYTLIKNPSLQKYTAKNMVLLTREKKLQKGKLFMLEHVIKNVEIEDERLNWNRNKKEISSNPQERALPIEEISGFMTKEDLIAVNEAAPIYPRITGTEEREDEDNLEDN